MGEMAIAYLAERQDPELADGLRPLLADSGDQAFLSLYEAERLIWKGEVQSPETLRYLDLAVGLAPNHYLPHRNRAWLLNQLGRPEEAFQELEAALDLRPDHLPTRHDLMRTLASLERMKEAWGEATNLIEGPQAECDPRLWAEASVLSGGFGRFEEAIDRMNRYLELEPYSPREWKLLARWYELAGMSGKQAEASANADLARENQVRELHRAARWHARFGEAENAVLALQEVLKMDPDNQAAREELRTLSASTR